MSKLLFGVLVLVIILGVGIVHNNYLDVDLDKDGKSIELIYQGPVPEGYDLNHFRKTGETIKSKLSNG